MMQADGVAATSVVPLMRYRDCAAAIEWLVRVFGFERHFVVGSEGGDVAYAQLTCGSGMIMIGPVGQSDLDDHFKQPDEIGGAATQSCYLTVDDIEAHYARAKAANAKIVMELKTASFGSQGYSCRDPEGHIWNFGSYDPWRGRRQPGQKARSAEPVARRSGIGRELTVLGLCLSALIATVSSVHTGLISLPSSLVASADDDQKALEANRAGQTVKALETQRAAVQALLDEARLDLERESAARKRAEQGASAAVERIAQDVRRELDSEKTARTQIEQRLAASEGEAAKLKEAKVDADLAIAELKQQLDAERKSKADAEAAARNLRERLSLSASPDSSSPAPLTTGSTASGADAAAANPKPAPSLSAQGAKPADKKEAKALPIDPAASDTKASSATKVKAWEKEVTPEPVKSKPVRKRRSKSVSSSGSNKSYKPKTAKPRPPKRDPQYRGPVL